MANPPTRDEAEARAPSGARVVERWKIECRDTPPWRAGEVVIGYRDILEAQIDAALSSARVAGREEGIARAVKAVPTSWLDALLSGPETALKGKGGTWGCPDVERLLRAIAGRIRALATEE